LDSLEAYKSRINRERKAREEAEMLLEKKSLELYEANKKLGEINKVLESKVTERTIELEQKARELLEAHQQLERFTYITSHDLKTPIRAIHSIVDWMAEDMKEGVAVDLSKNFDIIRDRLKYMQQMVNSIIRYTQSIELQFIIEKMDIKKWCADFIEDNFSTFNVMFEFEGLAEIQTDFQIKDVLKELISNAVIHNESNNKWIKIKIEVQESHLLIAVSDNGKGIEPEFAERIFNLFETLQSKSKTHTVGMGLSLVKKILRSRGDEIKVDSQLGTGSVFSFTWNYTQTIKPNIL
jgi:light-regulated signal transduction histidine kinase (bacteriophytochrome)